MKTVTINNQSFIIQQCLGAQILFEKMTINESKMGDTTNIITLLYCILKYKNKHFNFNFDEFCDILDENPEIITVFTDYLIELQSQQVEYLENELKKKITEIPNQVN